MWTTEWQRRCFVGFLFTFVVLTLYFFILLAFSFLFPFSFLLPFSFPLLLSSLFLVLLRFLLAQCIDIKLKILYNWLAVVTFFFDVKTSRFFARFASIGSERWRSASCSLLRRVGQNFRPQRRYTFCAFL